MRSVKGLVLRTGLVLLVVIAIALVPVEVSTGPPTASDGCEECHDGFVPFEVDAKAPGAITAGKEVRLECLVRNTGEHDVIDVIVELAGLGSGSGSTKVGTEFTGSVNRVSGATHAFDVTEGVTGLVVHMSEDAGPLGRGDARLVLDTPAGEPFVSDTGGPEEEIALDEEQIGAAGTGTFHLTVELVGGLRPVSYVIDVQVEFWNPETVKLLGDIGPGEEAVASWNVTLSEDGTSGLKALVTGTVSRAHEDGGRKQAYTVEKGFGDGMAKRGGTHFKIKPYRNGLGYVLITLMLVSLVTGYPKTRNLVPFLKGKPSLQFHCMISWTMVMVIAVHAYLASLTHPWWSPAVITGELMTVIFISLSIVPSIDWLKSGSRNRFLSRIGRRNWMMANRVAILIVLIVLGIHIYA